MANCGARTASGRPCTQRISAGTSRCAAGHEQTSATPNRDSDTTATSTVASTDPLADQELAALGVLPNAVVADTISDDEDDDFWYDGDDAAADERGYQAIWGQFGPFPDVTKEHALAWLRDVPEFRNEPDAVFESAWKLYDEDRDESLSVAPEPQSLDLTSFRDARQVGPDVDALARLDRLRKHQLMPDSVTRSMPGLGDTGNQGDNAVVHVKLFSIASQHTWYFTEYDPVTRVAYGVCDDGHGRIEDGSVSVDELRGVAFSPADAPAIERDKFWQPRPLSDLFGR